MAKRRSTRKRSQKSLHKKQLKSRKYKSSGWKLKQFPEIFKVIDYSPWIVRRDDKRYE